MEGHRVAAQAVRSRGGLSRPHESARAARRSKHRQAGRLAGRRLGLGLGLLGLPKRYRAMLQYHCTVLYSVRALDVLLHALHLLAAGRQGGESRRRVEGEKGWERRRRARGAAPARAASAARPTGPRPAKASQTKLLPRTGAP